MSALAYSTRSVVLSWRITAEWKFDPSFLTEVDVTVTPPSPTVGLFRERVVAPFARLLAHGVTPRKLAECVAIGLMVGVFPALGVTTLLAAIAAWLFRLNPIAIQLVNYLAYPLQFVLILPFFRAGQLLFNAPPLGMTIPQLAAFVRREPLDAVRTLWTTTWHASLVWLLACLVVVPLLTLTLTPVFRHLAPKKP